MSKIHYTRFPVGREAAKCYSDMANKSTTSCCSGIWEMTRHNRHNRLSPAPTCYELVVYVADLLWTCYRETGVMDFCLKRGLRGKWP